MRWVKPVEEILSNDEFGPFSVAASDPDNPSFQPGMVALRVNYPFQAAGLVRYVPTGNRVGDNVVEVDRVRANDDLIFSGDTIGKYTLAVPANQPPLSTFGGRFGLGATGSYRRRTHEPTVTPTPANSTNPDEYDWDIVEYGVRPYRRVITAQAIYRREVFE